MGDVNMKIRRVTFMDVEGDPCIPAGYWEWFADLERPDGETFSISGNISSLNIEAGDGTGKADCVENFQEFMEFMGITDTDFRVEDKIKEITYTYDDLTEFINREQS